MVSKVAPEMAALLNSAVAFDPKVIDTIMAGERIAPGLTALARMPKPAKNPDFADQWNILINTPGAHSSDPIFNTPPPPKETTMSTNEVVAADTTAAETIKLAEEMTAFFKSSDATCSLMGGASLTTWKPGGKGFSKTPHIGGEDFAPTEAYVGKKGKIIIKFRPVETVAYSHMEMLADEAMAQMKGFGDIAAASCEDGYVLRVAGVRRAVAMAREAEVAAVKVQEYSDFGSW